LQCNRYVWNLSTVKQCTILGGIVHEKNNTILFAGDGSYFLQYAWYGAKSC